MKPRLQLNSIKLVYSLGVVLLVGAITSALLATDPRWVNWHFSRLGEGGTIPAMIFNMFLLISAVIFFSIGLALKADFTRISDVGNINLKTAKNVICGAFFAVGICFVGVAFLTFDRFPVAHNIFGYSILISFVALLFLVPKVLPIFSRRFYIYNYLIIFSATISYTLFFFAKVITMLSVEFLMFIQIYVWILLLNQGICKRCNQKPLRDEKLSV